MIKITKSIVEKQTETLPFTCIDITSRKVAQIHKIQDNNRLDNERIILRYNEPFSFSINTMSLLHYVVII